MFPTHVLKRLGVDFSASHDVSATTGTGDGKYRIGNPKLIDCVYKQHVIDVAAYGSDAADVAVLGLHDFFRHYRITFEIDRELRGRFRLEPRLTATRRSPSDS